MISINSTLESLLFVCGDEGVSVQEAARVLEIESEEAKDRLDSLARQYRDRDAGIQIRKFGDVYQFTTIKEAAPYITAMLHPPERKTLSQAALETLAIVAYRQPITRIAIEEVRGVKSDRPIQTLVGKGLIQEMGRSEGVGRPILYGTTTQFLDAFELSSLEELPPLPEHAKTESSNEADLFFKEVGVDEITET
ncbi:SMC-Scp complex subunit ScpB [Salsuginibacillus kocurii]|uniref:SMC-Scp complex subunit ScpB n=1 Tax=Salsuginibacillus kocurii TaxID=427078 RepID=UPI000373435B|nr:SMC-Scp complex subunit ScpB [Salsuginibacillus kocurii]